MVSGCHSYLIGTVQPSQTFPLTQLRKSMSACRCEHELANPDRDADEAASSAWGTSSRSRNDSCVATSHVFCTHHSVCLKCLGLSHFPLFLFQEPPLSDFHLPILLSFFNGVLFLPGNGKYRECAAGLGFSCVSPEPIRVSGSCFLFKIGSWIVKDKISPLIYLKGSIKQDHNSKVGKPSVKEQISLYFLLVQTNRPASLLYFHTFSALSFPQSPAAPGSASALWTFQEPPWVSHLTAVVQSLKGDFIVILFSLETEPQIFTNK